MKKLFDQREYANQMKQSHIARGNYFSTMMYTSYSSGTVVYLERESDQFFNQKCIPGVIIQTTGNDEQVMLYFHFQLTNSHFFVAFNTLTWSVYLHAYLPEEWGISMTPSLETIRLTGDEKNLIPLWLESCKTFVQQLPAYRLYFVTGEKELNDTSAQNELKKIKG